jgi:hypothetical protein
MTLAVSTARSDQAEAFVTAPQGNVKQPSHEYVLVSPNATTTVNSGEVGQP